MLSKLSTLIQNILDFLVANWVGVIIGMVIILFSCWIYGYFSNAYFGTHFELASCWLGVGAISAASVAGLGKYYTDSKHNSLQGLPPIAPKTIINIAEGVVNNAEGNAAKII